MPVETAELDQLQKDYKAAVETWINAIRKEEALASTEHSVADIDQWEEAADDQEKAGDAVKEANSATKAPYAKSFSTFSLYLVSICRLCCAPARMVASEADNTCPHLGVLQ